MRLICYSASQDTHLVRCPTCAPCLIAHEYVNLFDPDYPNKLTCNHLFQNDLDSILFSCCTLRALLYDSKRTNTQRLFMNRVFGCKSRRVFGRVVVFFVCLFEECQDSFHEWIMVVMTHLINLFKNTETGKKEERKREKGPKKKRKKFDLFKCVARGSKKRYMNTL